jgi:PAS domain S-box-containing protein
VGSDDGLSARVVDDVPVGLFALDADGAVLLWNAEAERLSGWSAADVLGRNGFADDRRLVDTAGARHMLDELKAGRRFSAPLPAAVPSGRTLYVHAAPGGPGGAPVVGVLQDIGAALVGPDAFSLLDALWQNAPVGLAYFDSELRYRRVNGAVLTIDGGTSDQRIGRTLEELHGETGHRIADLLREVMRSGRPQLDVALSGRLWGGSGPLQSWLFNIYPVHGRSGSVIGVGLVVSDVTESERNRAELAELARGRERALRRYQSLVDATTAAVWIRLADGSAGEDAPQLRAITGQSPEEYLGWGFLDAMHPEDRAAVRQAWLHAVEHALAEPGSHAVFEHVYRLRTASGTYRWFRKRAVPVLLEGGLSEWVGTENDIDDEVRARHRMEILAGATLAVNQALDPETELAALAEAVVPEFADMCRVYLLDDDHLYANRVTGRRSVTRVAAGLPHVPGDEPRFVFGAGHPVALSVVTTEPVLDPGPPSAAAWPGTDAMLEWCVAVRMNSRLVAPVFSGGHVVAALVFVSCGDRAAYTADDLALVKELAARASAAVEHGRRFQQTREVSVALQDSMLTAPPTAAEIGIGGIELDARYLPAAAELEVGGDWYDAFRLPFGDLALAVGDVAGHDLAAAATMGQLRSMLRALAYDSDGDPSDVLRRLDRVSTRLAVTRFTTLVHGRVLARPGPGGLTRVFRWSNAGHPRPVLVTPDGTARFVEGVVDVVLGVEPDRLRHDQEVELPPGSTLLLYTDGLLERRDDPDDRAGQDLLDLAGQAAGMAVAELCDHVVQGSKADTGDDVVVLALRAL